MSNDEPKREDADYKTLEPFKPPPSRDIPKFRILVPLDLTPNPPVQQTDFTHSKGNALQACFASMFRLELAEVPNFILHPDGYMTAIDAWLCSKGLSCYKQELTPDGSLHHNQVVNNKAYGNVMTPPGLLFSFLSSILCFVVISFSPSPVCLSDTHTHIHIIYIYQSRFHLHTAGQVAPRNSWSCDRFPRR